jgi:hypothetical protein
MRSKMFKIVRKITENSINNCHCSNFTISNGAANITTRSGSQIASYVTVDVTTFNNKARNLKIPPQTEFNHTDQCTAIFKAQSSNT